jgi:hypothetical protein
MDLITRCLNCEGPVTLDDLVVTYQRRVIGAVCEHCTRDVKKPRITFTRSTSKGDFVAEQYICVEVFR